MKDKINISDLMVGQVIRRDADGAEFGVTSSFYMGSAYLHPVGYLHRTQFTTREGFDSYDWTLVR